MKELKQLEYNFEELEIEKLIADDGSEWEMFLPEKPRSRLPFANEHCEFKPVGWIRTDFGWLPMGYKLVTDELWSLELRNNPTPLHYQVGKWVFEERELEYNSKDFGGIWTALRKGGAKSLAMHCRNTWDMETRGFLTAIYNPIAIAGNYRIKSEGVMLLKEI